LILRFLSLNARKRLGRATSVSAFHAKLDDRPPELLLIQEPVARGREIPGNLGDYGLIFGHDGIAVYAASASVALVAHSDFYVECALGDTSLFNVYLDANHSSVRKRQVEQLGDRLRSLRSSRVLLVGDFNTAIRPQDGIYGESPSPWTTKSERALLQSFLGEHDLVDVLADDVVDRPTYTIERVFNGKPSCFRCDLLLASSDLMAGLNATYDHSWRTPQPAFTDHSAIWFELL
jgi:exonuclease III